MNIYIVADTKTYESIQVILQSKIDDVIIKCSEHDILKNTQLFSDPDEKIVAIEPTRINWSLPIDTLSKISNLRGICTSSAWARYIDFEFCKKHSIAVTKTIGANSQSVAEYAIWMMYSVARRLPIQLETKTDALYQTELSGKTLGIVGYGNIGSRIAILGQGVGMQVQYWNRSMKRTPYKCVTLEELLQTSDVIINSVEICDETQGLLGKSMLSLMKPTAFFISVLGGMGWGVQDDQWLLDMVQNDNLAGFAVENEHKGNWKQAYPGNVFIPMARAHHTKEAEDRVNEQWAEGVISVLKNTPSVFKIV